MSRMYPYGTAKEAWADTKAELDEMDRRVACPQCGHTTTYGELTWLNGKSTCPACYMARRAAEDAKRKEQNNG